MRFISQIDETGSLQEGEYIKPPEYCVKNHCKNKCNSFYEGIKSQEKECFYTCPMGMSVYIAKNGEIFTCMRERGSYDKIKAKPLSNYEERFYNPILAAEQLKYLIATTLDLNKEYDLIKEKRALLDSLTHEVRQLNAQIKAKSDSILTTYRLNDDNVNLTASDYIDLQNSIRTIFAGSSIIASRFSLYDYEKNPQALTNSPRTNCVVYKVFDKMGKILKNYQNRNVPIVIEGNSYDEMGVYPLFEMIPFSIVENAVKYTYTCGSNNVVKIVFGYTSDYKLKVTVNSYGPYCSEEESQKIFDKGYRGKNAQRVSAGSGIGLFFVKMLCDAHNISISAKSDNRYVTQISGVAHAPFVVTLIFNDVLHFE
jgi:signal transduction histidine kinase